MARRLTREEGLFVGGSSGLNVCVALQVAAELDDPQAYVVTILGDTGERYLSKFFSDDWMRENQMLEDERVTASAILALKPNADLELITIAPTSTVRQALNLMSTYNVSQLPVVQGGDCVGSVSDGLLMAQTVADASLLEQAVRDLMEAPYPVIDEAFPLDRLTALLSRETPAVLVRRNGELKGIVTRYDLLHQIAGIR